jgi:hypothetical protein
MESYQHSGNLWSALLLHKVNASLLIWSGRSNADLVYIHEDSRSKIAIHHKQSIEVASHQKDRMIHAKLRIDIIY